MAQVLIRNVDDAAVETHRERARAKGRSLEAELRELVNSGAKLTGEEKRALVERVLAENDKLINWDVPQTPGWVLIREDRDGR